MRGKILFAYSANSLGDFISTFVETWEYTARLTVPPIPSTAPFAWLTSNSSSEH